ncbi:fimbrial chaperone StfD [Salmonella enterica]|nr:fimbrial chaperone StfD [Salmonella enterica]EFP4634786.1 fimbrial chaperone StfD [Salmonella enterica]EFS0363246.1 fimbrial chaperone StfD [Salmonella enterica]EGK1505556.1 fimbrial chaperone StfD [Salmonella enterica]
MMPLKRHNLAAVLLLLLGGYSSAQAAIAPDRTRLVFRGEDKSISVDLKNANNKLPYLAQSWMEDEKGNKIDSPLTAVPPVQRIEAAGTGQIKIQGIPALAALPQDRETLFYYNVREIPPKSDKPNTLQIALQTRIKVFYRPLSLSKIDMQHPWQYKITLQREGDGYRVTNPTGYYVVLSNASNRLDGQPALGFSPLVIAPGGSAVMKVKASDVGSAPVLTYVNDYGARLPLVFKCSGSACTVDEQKSRKS